MQVVEEPDEEVVIETGPLLLLEALLGVVTALLLELLLDVVEDEEVELLVVLFQALEIVPYVCLRCR